MPSPADDFLHRLLAAHGALDAFDHDPEDDDGAGDAPEDPAAPAPPAWDTAGEVGVPWLGGPVPAHPSAHAAAAA